MIDTGFEQDITYSRNNYSGNIDSIGSFDIKAPNSNGNRLFAYGSLYHDLNENNQIRARISYEETRFNNEATTAIYINYGVSF